MSIIGLTHRFDSKQSDFRAGYVTELQIESAFIGNDKVEKYRLSELKEILSNLTRATNVGYGGNEFINCGKKLVVYYENDITEEIELYSRKGINDCTVAMSSKGHWQYDATKLQDFIFFDEMINEVY